MEDGTGAVLKIWLLDGTQNFSVTLCQAQRGSSLALLKHGCEMGPGGSREPGSTQIAHFIDFNLLKAGKAVTRIHGLLKVLHPI